MTSIFPTLRITSSGFIPSGAFAESQATFLQPDERAVARLDAALESTETGVVAHFYMDAELQGVLGACRWPHIHVSDSLVMADRAIAMARAGVRQIVVLGVDFMSENVRAMLDAAGFEHIPVYRVSAAEIGCSLAQAADSAAYERYLEQAVEAKRALHVIYINTSLWTKAHAHSLVPTITCTSSNVVKTVLQAFAQVPDLQLFFGPDTYMGGNLRELFRRHAQLSDAAVGALHPGHDRQSLGQVLKGLHVFEQGMCAVHQMFGRKVSEQLVAHYPDAYYAAHLEVPGEMFSLALQAQADDRGVVGSTSNILSFIERKLKVALETSGPQQLSFVLGTEAGMITSITRHVRQALSESGRSDVTLDIVFPLASELAAAGADGLSTRPGLSLGDGCVRPGEPALCPYMKMNKLPLLLSVLDRVEAGDTQWLAPYVPRAYVERLQGRSAAELGSEPILHMRSMQKHGALPEALIEDILTRR